MTTFHFGIDTLTVDRAVALTEGRLKGVIGLESVKQILKSRKRLESIIRSNRAVYGINTGFGPLCDVKIAPEATHTLQKNLLLTHAVGVGPNIDKRLSKLMMICKVHALCQGYSGIRLLLVERILFFIENDLLPVVPAQGSVGASGDLAPLAHLFLPLIGEGHFWVGDDTYPAKTVLERYHLEPLSLEVKEGLALINGTQFILAHAVWGLHKMHYLLDLADIAGTMSLEGFQGSWAPFRAELHAIRPFTGNITVAKRVRKLLKGSQNLLSHQDCARVQDPYSLRCMPQVHGASRNAWAHLHELTEIELNSVTDNPIIIGTKEALSGGNFHGQPLAMVLDYASVAASEMGNISDRRCYCLLEGKFELPRMLTEKQGINSGFMMPQCTVAALVSENRSLCFPASADSIPTSLGQEDHVSMGSISGRRFNRIIDNLEKILAIELMYAAQALEFRRPNTFSPFIEKNLNIIRKKVDKLEKDRLLKNDIDAMISMVQERVFIVN